MIVRLKGKKARRIRQRITSETQVRVREIKSLLTDNRDRAETIKDDIAQSAREKGLHVAKGEVREQHKEQRRKGEMRGIQSANEERHTITQGSVRCKQRRLAE